MNPNIYEAALDLGATPFQALRKVLLPMLKPGMISGFILAFTMSLDDFAVTFFTRGTIGLDTPSTYIYTDGRESCGSSHETIQGNISGMINSLVKITF
jgi:spermidine/putrescine transport system permease protein